MICAPALTFQARPLLVPTRRYVRIATKWLQFAGCILLLSPAAAQKQRACPPDHTVTARRAGAPDAQPGQPEACRAVRPAAAGRRAHQPGRVRAPVRSGVSPGARAWSSTRGWAGYAQRLRSRQPRSQRSTKPQPASRPRQRSTVSRSTPASTAIVDGPAPPRPGSASSTLALSGSSSSRDRFRWADAGPRAGDGVRHRPPAGAEAAGAPSGVSISMTSAAQVTQVAPHSLMIRWQPADWRRRHRSGHGHQRPAELGGVPCGVQRTAALTRLHDHGAARQRGDDPVADQEPHPRRVTSRRPFADHEALGGDAANSSA